MNLRRAQYRAVRQSEMDSVNSTFDQRIQHRRDWGRRLSPWHAKVLGVIYHALKQLEGRRLPFVPAF